MNWLLVGSVGGGVTVVHVESGGMTYSAAQKLADEINAMYAAKQSVCQICQDDDFAHGDYCPECGTRH